MINEERLRVMCQMDVEFRAAVYEPGNGTRYELLVAGPVPRPVDSAALGSVSKGGYLVTLGLTGASWLFQGSGYLDGDYVSEKLKVSGVDAEAVTEVLGLLLGRPTSLAPRNHAVDTGSLSGIESEGEINGSESAVGDRVPPKAIP